MSDKSAMWTNKLCRLMGIKPASYEWHYCKQQLDEAYEQGRRDENEACAKLMNEKFMETGSGYWTTAEYAIRKRCEGEK